MTGFGEDLHLYEFAFFPWPGATARPPSLDWPAPRQVDFRGQRGFSGTRDVEVRLAVEKRRERAFGPPNWPLARTKSCLGSGDLRSNEQQRRQRAHIERDLGVLHMGSLTLEHPLLHLPGFLVDDDAESTPGRR